MTAPQESLAEIAPEEFDPVFLHTRRDAIIIFCVWALAFVWVIPFSYNTGYLKPGENISTIVGIPTWMFWGVFVPWLLADVFTLWFCLFHMKDHDLGPEGQPETEAD